MEKTSLFPNLLNSSPSLILEKTHPEFTTKKCLRPISAAVTMKKPRNNNNKKETTNFFICKKFPPFYHDRADIMSVAQCEGMRYYRKNTTLRPFFYSNCPISNRIIFLIISKLDCRKRKMLQHVTGVNRTLISSRFLFNLYLRPF